MNIRRYAKDIKRALQRDQFNIGNEGVLLFHDGLLLSGEYFDEVNGRDRRVFRNKVVDQGAINLFNVMFGSVAKIATWYLAPFSGSTTPAANWTAANFTSNATEITSSSEGYTEATRRSVTFTDATVLDQIDNYSSKAAFTIITASELTITGLGLLSVNTKGSTGGVLYSAGKFATSRKVQNGDVWTAGYRAVGTPT